MTKYIVTGRAYNRKTHKAIGKQRNETINTNSNVLFKHTKTGSDVKMRYESFWNDLDPHSKEVVKVLKIKRKK